MDHTTGTPGLAGRTKIVFGGGLTTKKETHVFYIYRFVSLYNEKQWPIACVSLDITSWAGIDQLS
jgi:hypothetical protein